jgi:hypothetical protein
MRRLTLLVMALTLFLGAWHWRGEGARPAHVPQRPDQLPVPGLVDGPPLR